MTAEECASQLINAYGMPASEALLRAMLELAFSDGKIVGLARSAEKFDLLFKTAAERVA